MSPIKTDKPKTLQGVQASVESNSEELSKKIVKLQHS